MGHLKRSIGIRGLGYGMVFLLVIVATLWGATYAMADEPTLEQSAESEMKSNRKPLGMESRKGYRGKHDMAEIKKDLDDAVESGRITQEQADERLQVVVEGKGKSSGPGPKKSSQDKYDMAKIKKDLNDAVESGRITQGQADERMGRLLESQKGSKKLDMMDPDEKIRHVQEEIEENVKSGKLTRAEADEKHRVLREKLKASKKQ